MNVLLNILFILIIVFIYNGELCETICSFIIGSWVIFSSLDMYLNYKGKEGIKNVIRFKKNTRV
jgi:hypothetical protein